ncbi:auxin efflux carrier [Fomitopsis serialis]|uniref:auxin efflux carrier n=1 Tax=Fomitopsis serialis TaxID=139415 RepID=UPI00200838D4|nr:auxin efflux carrier [Neoantrodia serialis]KAH9916054.1 auxin efflux carrier [Neoantrodia serialis]
MASSPIGPLVLVVFESILEVFIICFAGWILAVQGILDKKTQKQINRVNVSLFTPALLFSKVAFFLTPAKLAQLWVIPIVFIIVTLVSMAVAYLLAWMLKLKKSQRNFAIAAAMFMNSNTLPIALMQSLVVTVPNLKWGDDDTQSDMLGRALTYLVLYSTLGMIVRWSYGVRLLADADPEAIPDAPANSPVGQNDNAHTSSMEADHTLRREPSSLTDADDAKTLTHVRIIEEPKSLPSSRSISPQPQASTSGTPSLYASEGERTNVDLPLGDVVPELEASVPDSRSRRVWNRIRKAWAGFCDFMTVPLWAALASIIVACITPLQVFIEDHVPPITGALTQAGNCSIPLTLVVLGVYFYTPPDKRQQDEQLPTHKSSGRKPSWAARSRERIRKAFSRKKSGEGNQARPGETKTVLVAVLARMVITPILLVPLIAVAAKYDLQRLFQDPVFIVSNVLLIASPPALTLAQITQAASGDAFERLLSKTIFWSYCVLTAPSTIIVVVLGLILAKL